MEMPKIAKPEFNNRIWCCAWGFIKPETYKCTSEDTETSSCSSTTKIAKQKPTEFVISGGIESQLKVIHVSPTKEHVFPYEYTLELPGMGAHYLAISPNSSCIAAVTVDGNLTLLDVKDGVRLPIVSHRLVSNLWSAAFGGSNDSVYAGSGNGEIFKYDTILGKLQHSYDTEHCENILGLAISKDHSLLGATDYGGHFSLIDGATGKLIYHGSYKSPMRKLVFDPGMRYALAACDDTTIKILDLPSGTLRHSLQGHETFVMSVAASPDGQRFVSGSCDGTIKVWDSRSTKTSMSFVCGSNNNLWDVAFNQLSNKISFVGDGKGLCIYYCLGNREFMLI